MEKFRSKLSKWKVKCLWFGGRLMLVNSMLSSIPLYFFPYFEPLKILLIFSRDFGGDFYAVVILIKKELIRLLGR